MIRFSDDAKSIKIPRNLGPNQSSVEGGISREECIQIVDNAIEDYDDEVIDPLKDTVEGKSTVEWDQQVTGGTKIAVVTIDGTPTDVYAPTSGGGGVTPEQVQQQIDESLVDYPTSAVTQDLEERVTELENASVDYATTADTQALETAISGKSTVDWNQIVTGGTKVAEITIDGTKTDVYAPTSGGGGVTPQDVQDAIDSALTPYSTTQQIEGMLEDYSTTAHTHSQYATTADTAGLQTQINGKQDALTPGAGIQISGDTISAKRAVYNYTELSGMTATDLGTAMVEMRDRYADGWDVYIEIPVNATNATSASTVLVKLNAVKDIPASLTLNFEAGGPVGRWAIQLQRTTSTGQGALTRAIGLNGAVTKAMENGSDYLPTATAGTKGGIYVGNGLTAPSGTLSVKPATANSIGGIIVGSGLSVDANGVLSATGGGGGGDGYVWTTDAEYDAMTTAEKEAWYDNIYSGATDGNYKFGIIVTTEPWNPEEHQDLDVKCRSLRLCWVEDGYDSLHFNDANYSDNNFRGMEYRIARGGNWERIDEKNLDITKFTESAEDRRVFKITTGLTAYGGFDCYMFNRAFSEPQQPWEYYSAVGSMPLLIVSPHQDNPDEYDLVCTANILACGEAPSNLYIDGWAKRFVFRYFLNGELYEAIMDSVSGGSGDGLHLIHNYSVYGNWVGSQADYNAIGAGNYDSKVIYHIDR